MILFTIGAIGILIYSIFADDWLIDYIKRDIKSEHPIKEIVDDVAWWLLGNVLFNMANAGIVFLISCGMLITLANTRPAEQSQWEFNINALEDNLVTEGHYYGRRGYVDGELSYFYSRTFSNGEKIGHIPADKTYVQYNDDEHPHVEVHNSRIDIPDWMYDAFFLEFMNKPTTKYYVLVVPEGTITNTGEYAIDMK